MTWEEDMKPTSEASKRTVRFKFDGWVPCYVACAIIKNGEGNHYVQG